jgi:anti-anti-sigma regulatory factor
MLMPPWRVRPMVEDGLARIEITGVFDAHTATAVRAEFHEFVMLADAVLLDLEAVTGLQEGFDLPGLVDEIQRHCWIAGCRLRLSATHPSVRASLSTQGFSYDTAAPGIRVGMAAGKAEARTGHKICEGLY